MELKLNPAELTPIIRQTIEETLAEVGPTNDKLAGRLAFTEAEAAELMGIERYVLRDARLRGEIDGSKVGKMIIYEPDVLREFITSRRMA